MINRERLLGTTIVAAAWTTIIGSVVKRSSPEITWVSDTAQQLLNPLIGSERILLPVLGAAVVGMIGSVVWVAIYRSRRRH